jgi:hypothetical protein
MYEERWPWLDFTGLAFAASPIRRDVPIFHARFFSLQLHPNSSYTSHVPGYGRWRHTSAVERIGFGSSLGSLRATEGGKSGVVTLFDRYRKFELFYRPIGFTLVALVTVLLVYEHRAPTKILLVVPFAIVMALVSYRDYRRRKSK